MFQAVRIEDTRKKSAYVVEQIIQAIKRGELRAGDKLPSERAIAKAMNISRNSVREALSALQVFGLVISRAGDGTYVKSGASLTEAKDEILALLEESDNPFDALEERKFLESGAAELAAQNATEEHLRALRAQLEAMHRAVVADDVDAYLQANKAFHLGIATATGNTLIESHIRALLSVMEKRLWRSIKRSFLFGEERAAESFSIHDEVYTAIANRDPAAAARKIRRHFEMIEQQLHKHTAKEGHPA